MSWYWIALIVYTCFAVFLGFLGLFVKPLRVVFIGFVSVWKFLAEFIYVLLVWWWLSILRFVRHRPCPRFWLFGGRV